MAKVRVQKLQEFIKQEVGQMLLRDLKDPRLGFVTVTDVAVTGDLQQATIYVSLFGKEEEKAASWEALRRAKGFIRRELGSRLQLRLTPDIEFALDTSIDYGNRIEAVLKQIRQDGEEKHEG